MIPERYTDPAVALKAWRAATGYTCREVGTIFGVSRDAVRQWEHGICRVPVRVQARLRREGWLAGRWSPWTAEHDAWLDAHRHLYPLRVLAERLTAAFGIPRTPNSVQHHLYDRGESAQLGGTCFTRAQVAALCGVSPPTVKRWVERGMLQLPVWARDGVRGSWAVPPAALLAFVTIYAVELHAAAMPPSVYRQAVEDAWTRHRWIDTETAGRYAGVHRSTICGWIGRGWLPAVRKHCEHTIYIWMVRPRDLAAFLRARDQQRSA